MFEIIPNWHPIFVHFTVALFSLAIVLSVVTPFVRPSLKGQWHTVTLWSLWFGAGFTVITGLTGLYAYNTVGHDAPSHAAMTDHRNWAIATIVVFFTLALWSIVRVRRNKILGPFFVVGMLAAGSVLASTAWRGGEVVFRYGLGVMSLPQVEGEGHAHEHGEGDEHHASDGATASAVTANNDMHGHDGDDAHHDDEASLTGNESEHADTHHDHGDHEH